MVGIVDVKERGAVIRQESALFSVCVCTRNTGTYTGTLTVEEGNPFEYLKKGLR